MQVGSCTTQNTNSLNLVLTKPDRGDCFCSPPFTSYCHCPGDLLWRWGKPQEGIFILICRNAFCGVWICGNTVKGIGYCGPYLLDWSFLSVLRQCPTVPLVTTRAVWEEVHYLELSNPHPLTALLHRHPVLTWPCLLNSMRCGVAEALS